MPAKKYRCTNFADCERALSKELIEIAEGAEPDCAHANCRKYLVEEPDHRPPPFKKIALVAAGCALLAGATFMLWPKVDQKPTLPLTATCDIKAMEAAYKKGDCAVVIKMGDECLARAPNDSTALNNIATCLLKSGEPARAKDLLQRALALKPNDPYLHYNQACVEARAGNQAEAFNHLKKACHFGLAPATFIQDPDLASMKGYTPFDRLLTTKNCDE